MLLKLKNQKQFQLGVALVEFLIASFIGLMLIGVILQNYLDAKKIYKTQNEINYISENIRFAELFMHQSITQAGFAGCRKISEFNLSPKNNIAFTNFNVIHGYHSDSIMEENLAKDLKGKIVPNTDLVVIVKANSRITPVRSINSNKTLITVDENPATDGNLLLLISDCKNAELVIADTPRNKTIILKDPLKHSYNPNTTFISSLERLAFFISETEQHSYSLYFLINHGKKQELIPKISNMQILYGVDTQNQGRVTQQLKAAEVTNRSLWENVLSVTIKLTPQNQSLKLKPWEIYIKLRERSMLQE